MKKFLIIIISIFAFSSLVNASEIINVNSKEIINNTTEEEVKVIDSFLDDLNNNYNSLDDYSKIYITYNYLFKTSYYVKEDISSIYELLINHKRNIYTFTNTFSYMLDKLNIDNKILLYDDTYYNLVKLNDIYYIITLDREGNGLFLKGVENLDIYRYRVKETISYADYTDIKDIDININYNYYDKLSKSYIKREVIKEDKKEIIIEKEEDKKNDIYYFKIIIITLLIIFVIIYVCVRK